MPRCVQCNKTQSKLNPGSLCKEHYSISHNVSNELEDSNDISEVMTAIPDLPDNWVEEPLSNLTEGYLLRILNHVNETWRN